MLIVTNSFAGGEQLVQEQHQSQGVEAGPQARQNLDTGRSGEGTLWEADSHRDREALWWKAREQGVPCLLLAGMGEHPGAAERGAAGRTNQAGRGVECLPS